MDSIPLAGGIEDRSTNAPYVVQKLEKMMDLLYYVLGIEMIHAAQAMDLRPKKQFGRITGQVHDILRERVAFYDSDNRMISDDIEAAYELLRSGELLGRLALPDDFGKSKEE